MNNNNFTIISFYQFRDLKKLILLKKILREICSFHKLRGTILLASEGINGSLAGLDDSIKQFLKVIHLNGFHNLELKYSKYKFMPFNRLKIKIKKEIITFSKNKLDVENKTAIHIDYKKWNQLIEDNKTYILDVRNNFEHKMGTFNKSINPKTKHFSEFKKFVDKNLDPKIHSKIAMFCTGGIRCEKASSYMLKKGFKNLYQLKGGILKYLENIPKEKSNWNGECFVFDSRVSVRNELQLGTYEMCHGCRKPLNKFDIKSKKYEKGVACENCYNKTSAEKKKRLRERNKQIKIAKKKGIFNPYIRYTTSNFF